MLEKAIVPHPLCGTYREY